MLYQLFIIKQINAGRYYDPEQNRRQIMIGSERNRHCANHKISRNPIG